MVEPGLTSTEATSQIIGLINSKPTTPWPAEVKAIVDRVVNVPAATPAMPAHVVAYRAKTQEFYRHSEHVMGPLTFDAPNHDVEYERNTELGRQADVAGDVVLNTPPTTWGDIIGLASMVAHEAGHDLDALGPRRTKDGDPGPIAAEMLALAVLRLHAKAVPQIVPVDVAWREQRDIIDRTAVETAGILTFEEAKPSEEIRGKAVEAACDLAKQIWERAKPETRGGERVSPLTLAVLAEIVLHHDNGASNTLDDGEEYYMDQRATAELMVG
jgi:hypothetical protein